MTNIGLQIELPLVTVYRPRANALSQDPNNIVGWIGLLNCRLWTESELVGIVLSKSRRGTNGECQKVQIRDQRLRTKYNFPLTHAILVNESVAIQAVLTNIIIIHGDESEPARRNFFEVQKYIFTESSAVQDMGYSVSTGSCVGFLREELEIEFPEMKWNEKTKILTVVDSASYPELYRFVFQSSEGFPEFAVITRETNTIVRRISQQFSREEYRQLFDSLGEFSRGADAGNMSLRSDDGK